MPVPPYSSSTVMPCSPSAPIFGQIPRGNLSVRSISAASGAISSSAKARTVSRSWSISAPRSKSSDGERLLGMNGLRGIAAQVYRRGKRVQTARCRARSALRAGGDLREGQRQHQRINAAGENARHIRDAAGALQIVEPLRATEAKRVGLGDAGECRSHIVRLGDGCGDDGERAAAATEHHRQGERHNQKDDAKRILLAIEEPGEE